MQKYLFFTAPQYITFLFTTLCNAVNSCYVSACNMMMMMLFDRIDILSSVSLSGSYPCRQYNFVLQRDIGYFLIQVYIPSILIVILSWVAFWINIDAIPARVSLGLLTVLTMTTQSAGARSSLPRVSYIKAIDVWMSVCLIFVFASLLEFAVVNVFSRKEPRTIKPIRRQPKNRDPEAIPMGEVTHRSGFSILISSIAHGPSQPFLKRLRRSLQIVTT